MRQRMPILQVAASLAIALATLLAAPSTCAQTIGQNAPLNFNNNFTISVSSQLVVETIVVKDKKGNSIKGLTAKDFSVTEDGAQQTLRFCEHQTLPQTPATPMPAGSEDLKLYRRLVHSQIAPEPPGNVHYKDRRLLALYFDMSAMPPNDQLRAL